MTEEEYLVVCGWECSQFACNDDAPWTHERRASRVHGMPLRFTLTEAVKAQLAEDRARYNFVRERSEMHGGMLCPITGKIAPPTPKREPWPRIPTEADQRRIHAHTQAFGGPEITLCGLLVTSTASKLVNYEDGRETTGAVFDCPSCKDDELKRFVW